MNSNEIEIVFHRDSHKGSDKLSPVVDWNFKILITAEIGCSWASSLELSKHLRRVRTERHNFPFFFRLECAQRNKFIFIMLESWNSNLIFPTKLFFIGYHNCSHLRSYLEWFSSKSCNAFCSLPTTIFFSAVKFKFQLLIPQKKTSAHERWEKPPENCIIILWRWIGIYGEWRTKWEHSNRLRMSLVWCSAENFKVLTS